MFQNFIQNFDKHFDDRLVVKVINHLAQDGVVVLLDVFNELYGLKCDHNLDDFAKVTAKG